MKNVDVPIWDKGDSTDNFNKGGSSRVGFGRFPSSEENNPEIKEIYELVFGREPSSRETSYYKYSTLKKADIIKKLLESDEHKGNLEKVKEYPVLKSESKKQKSTILKLRSVINDTQNEFLELKRLLMEKNRIIDTLRENKDAPYLNDRKILDDKNVHYSISRDIHKEIKKPNDFLDRLRYLIMGEDK